MFKTFVIFLLSLFFCVSSLSAYPPKVDAIIKSIESEDLRSFVLSVLELIPEAQVTPEVVESVKLFYVKTKPVKVEKNTKSKQVEFSTVKSSLFSILTGIHENERAITCLSIAPLLTGYERVGFRDQVLGTFLKVPVRSRLDLGRAVAPLMQGVFSGTRKKIIGTFCESDPHQTIALCQALSSLTCDLVDGDKGNALGLYYTNAVEQIWEVQRFLKHFSHIKLDNAEPVRALEVLYLFTPLELRALRTLITPFIKKDTKGSAFITLIRDHHLYCNKGKQSFETSSQNILKTLGDEQSKEDFNIRTRAIPPLHRMLCAKEVFPLIKKIDNDAETVTCFRSLCPLLEGCKLQDVTTLRRKLCVEQLRDKTTIAERETILLGLQDVPLPQCQEFVEDTQNFLQLGYGKYRAWIPNIAFLIGVHSAKKNWNPEFWKGRFKATPRFIEDFKDNPMMQVFFEGSHPLLFKTFLEDGKEKSLADLIMRTYEDHPWWFSRIIKKTDVVELLSYMAIEYRLESEFKKHWYQELSSQNLNITQTLLSELEWYCSFFEISLEKIETARDRLERRDLPDSPFYIHRSLQVKKNEDVSIHSEREEIEGMRVAFNPSFIEVLNTWENCPTEDNLSLHDIICELCYRKTKRILSGEDPLFWSRFDIRPNPTGGFVSTYFMILLGKNVPQNQETPAFDFSKSYYNPGLMLRSRQEVLDVFYQYLTPRALVNDFVTFTNQNPVAKSLIKNEEDSPFHPKTNEMTMRGAIRVLNRLGVLRVDEDEKFIQQ